MHTYTYKQTHKQAHSHTHTHTHTHVRTCVRTYVRTYTRTRSYKDTADFVTYVFCFKVCPAQNAWDGKTIEVRGFNTSTTDDGIELFFESKRRSGGGPVEKVTRDTDNNVTYVTFEDPLG